MLDSCHSGGFWGNNEETNGYDLSQVPNTSLLAAARETGLSEMNILGRSYFSQAIVDGLTQDDLGFAFASDDDLAVSITDLYDYILDWYDDYYWRNLDDQELVIGLRDYTHGSTVPLTEGSFDVRYYSNSNFEAWLPLAETQASVPEPKIIYLLTIGLFLLFIGHLTKNTIRK